ncbi:MAG TPA: ankyrin repeat domain-containing protein [Kribbella sp.]|jgi:ankyrin repeat protein
MSDDMSDDDKLTELAHFVFDLARAGDDERLAAYLDGGVPINLTDPAGNTLVMLAAYNGQPSTVKLLADRGADVNTGNDRGQTPIAGAVFKGETEVVRALLAAGADPRAGTPNAIDTARMFQQMALLAELEGNA